jgi:hypothetical protein
MLTSAWNQVNRAKEKKLCCSCERLRVSDTIAAENGACGSLMQSDCQLTVMSDGAATSGQLTRREIVRRWLACVGAGAVWPLVAASHPIRELLANDAIFAKAKKLGAADWKPLVLSAQQDETLGALAERIVPGSMAAQVNRFIDLLLSVDAAEHKQTFIESLAAFESESQKRFGKRFPALDAGHQDLLLAEASANAVNESSAATSTAEKHSTLHEHFENLKGWISGAYYSSEAGIRELGWTGDYVFESFPGCTHSEGHH